MTPATAQSKRNSATKILQENSFVESNLSRACRFQEQV